MKGTNMALTKEQAAHLNQRISERVNALRYLPRDPKPAAVAKAESTVSAWIKAQDDKAAERARRVSAAKLAAQEYVLAGDWASALAAVKKFESTKF